MNIKTEAPLNILISQVGFHQPVVGDVPETRGDHQTDPDKVHKYHVQQKFYKSPEVDAEDEGEAGLQTNLWNFS